MNAEERYRVASDWLGNETRWSSEDTPERIREREQSLADLLDRVQCEARSDLWKPTDADSKYGRDHGSRITLGELVALVLSKEGDENAFLDALDSEFLLGCWGHALKERQDVNLLRDLRGFIVETIRQVRAGMRR